MTITRLVYFLVLRATQSITSCTNLYLCFRPKKLLVELADASLASVCAFDP